jgi:hypothetical protein
MIISSFLCEDSETIPVLRGLIVVSLHEVYDLSGGVILCALDIFD